MSIKNSVTTSDYLNFHITLDKAIKMIQSDRDYKIGFLILFAINTGLLISDILKLRVDDLNNGSLLLVETKYGKKNVVKLNNNIKIGYKLLKGRNPNMVGYVFTSNQNTVFSVQYVNRKLKKVFASDNLNISTHSLRKTFGRQVWVNNNETDDVLIHLSKLFNQSSLRLTKRYLDIDEQKLDDIYMNL